jgi:hypothetical protein
LFTIIIWTTSSITFHILVYSFVFSNRLSTCFLIFIKGIYFNKSSIFSFNFYFLFASRFKSFYFLWLIFSICPTIFFFII